MGGTGVSGGRVVVTVVGGARVVGALVVVVGARVVVVGALVVDVVVVVVATPLVDGASVVVLDNAVVVDGIMVVVVLVTGPVVLVVAYVVVELSSGVVVVCACATVASRNVNSANLLARWCVRILSMYLFLPTTVRRNTQPLGRPRHNGNEP
jgi:hypothetical protein